MNKNSININRENSDAEYISKALSYKNLRERYEYIYDLISERLDEDFKNNNYCDFREDKCIAQRERKTAKDTMGCCYEFEYSKMMQTPIDKGLCRYMKNTECTQKCITCKLFTCRYLRAKGIYFDLDKIAIINVFFNKKQKKVIKTSFFKTKEEIIEKLLQYAK